MSFSNVIRNIWDFKSIYLAFFLCATSVSLMGPIFPKEASKKAMSSSVTGCVFAMYHLSLMITNISVGKMLSFLEPKYVLTSGVILNGMANTAFGFIVYINNSLFFVISSFSLRILEGVGFAMCTTTIFTLVIRHNKSMGLTEAVCNIGMAFGYVFGAFLFDVGGFTLPFAVSGVITVLVSPFVYRSFQNLKDDHNIGVTHESMKGRETTYTNLITLPKIILISATNVIASMNVTYLNPVFQVQVLSHHGNQVAISITYLFRACFIMLSSVIVGQIISERNAVFICAMGFIISSTLFFVTDPSDVISYNPLYSYIGFASVGIGVGMALIPTLPIYLYTARVNGYNDKASEHLISGIREATFSFGGIIGPFICGSVSDKYGFTMSVKILVLLNILAAAWTLLMYCDSRCIRFKVKRFGNFNDDTKGKNPGVKYELLECE